MSPCMSWDIVPGDMVELKDGRRGMVLSTAYLLDIVLIAVEVCFDWAAAEDIAAWIPMDTKEEDR